jgi:hypothetical protein
VEDRKFYKNVEEFIEKFLNPVGDTVSSSYLEKQNLGSSHTIHRFFKENDFQEKGLSPRSGSCFSTSAFANYLRKCYREGL